MTFLPFQYFFKMNLLTRLLIFSLAIYLSSCGSIAPSANSSGPRTLILDGKSVAATDVNGFTSWYCNDFVHSGPTLVEVGYFNKPTLDDSGFILYEGGFTGIRTDYSRTGLDHRWDWSLNGGSYSFIVKPDGTGLYYDFTSVPYGESTKATDVYKCYLRKQNKSK